MYGVYVSRKESSLTGSLLGTGQRAVPDWRVSLAPPVPGWRSSGRGSPGLAGTSPLATPVCPECHTLRT